MLKNRISHFFSRLHTSEDTEHQQGYIRLLFLSATFAYLYFTGVHISLPTAISLFFYTTFGIVTLIWVGYKPEAVESRRLVIVAIDIVMLSIFIWLLGYYYGPIFFPLYLWCIVGFAFRYGERYMWLSALLTLPLYSIILSSWDYWTPITWGQIISIFLIPVYIVRFIRRVNLSLNNAERANQQKNRFVAVISHELRNPLASIVALSDLIDKRGDKNDPYIDKIKESSSQMLHVIDDTLDYTSSESTEKKSKPLTILSLPDVINYSIGLFETEINEKNLSVILDFSSEIPKHVYGVSGNLRQLFTNLLANAVKFTKHGNITIKASLSNRTPGNNSCVCLLFEISDTGIGIIQDKNGDIFDEFKQADGQYNGSGLGLAICKRIVNDLGGEIRFSSIPGNGTTFYFDLNFKKAPIQDNNILDKKYLEKQPLTALLPEPITVLIAEDNTHNQYVYTEILTLAGCTVIVAKDGNEAIEKLRRFEYDIAIIDHQMPNCTGYEVMQFYRDEIDDDMRLILLSADTTERTKKLYGSLPHVIAYKPIRQNELVAIVHKQALELFGKDNTQDIDISAIIEKRKLHVDPAKSLELYISSFELALEKLKLEIESNNKNQIMKILHELLGTAGQAGANTLCALLRFYHNELENHNSGPIDLAYMFSHIERKYKKSVTEYKSLLSGNSNILYL